MTKDKERISTETQFINLLLNHKDLAGDWYNSNLKPFYFDKSHRLLLFAIGKAYDSDNLLTRKSFMEFAKKKSTSSVDLNFSGLMFDTISLLIVDRNDFELLKNKIAESYISEKAIDFIDEYSKSKNALGISEAVHELSKKFNGLVTDSVNEKQIFYSSVSTYAPDFYARLLSESKKEDSKEIIRCGIKEIDDTMVVGFAPGTLTLFAADVGGYKSTMMLNIAINVWKYGKNVLFVPLEMPRDKMYQKMLSNLTRINFERLQNPKLLSKDEWETVKGVTDDLNAPRDNQFYIMESYERVPVSIIRREIEKHIDMFKPHLVVIDYIANLVPETGSKVDRSRNDLQIGEMLKDLRSMGKPGGLHEVGFSIVSGVQIGREALKRMRKVGINKTAFYSEDLRGSHEYSADADNIYAQNPDEAQPDSRLQFFVVKARYGKRSFHTNETRAMLEVQPAISLIESIDDSWLSHNQTNILKKIKEEDLDDDLTFDDFDDIKADDKKEKSGVTTTTLVEDDIEL